MILRLRKNTIIKLKKDFNPNIISTVYEDGRYVAYPKSKNPIKDTQEKINKFNTLSNYTFSMQKLIEYKIKTGCGIFYFNNPHQLLDRLELLGGSIRAGNYGVIPEFSQIAHLLNQIKVITKKQLNDLLKKRYIN